MVKPTTQPDPLLGARLEGGYQVKRLLGQGAMGRVYEGVQLPQGRPVAIKVIAISGGASLYWHKRFVREATLTSKLASPHSIRLQHFGHTEAGMPFMVMELLEGRELAADISEDAPFPISRALRIGRQVLRSLHEAHELGIVHRDLKPANVFMCEGFADDHAKVMDFGLAASHSDPGIEKLTRTGVVMGTPAYMAPEQAVANTTDARSDLYAFGVILFEMLTGRRLFVGDTTVKLLLCQIQAAPPTLAEANPELAGHPELQALLDRLLAKDPEDRLPSAKAVLDQFDGLERTHGADEDETETVLLDVVPDLPPKPTPTPAPLRAVDGAARRTSGSRLPRRPTRARHSASHRKVAQKSYMVVIEVSLSSRAKGKGEVVVYLQGLNPGDPGAASVVRGLTRKEHIWRGKAQVHTARPGEVRLRIDLAGQVGAPWRVRIWLPGKPARQVYGRRGRLSAARQQVDDRFSLE